MKDPDGLPVLTWSGDADRLDRLVRELQMLVLAHPVVAQRLYVALVAQGRAAAATEVGRERRAALAGSPLLARLRALWEPGTFNLLEAEPTGPLPSFYLDVLAMTLDLEDAERLLANLAAGSGGGSDRGR